MSRGPDLPPFSDEDSEAAELLEEVGLDGRTARVLTYLRRVPEARSRDLQRVLGLRQPEVSVATQELRERGWVEAVPRKLGGKGRPVHHYRLVEPWKGVLADLEAELRERLDEGRAVIAQVQDLLR